MSRLKQYISKIRHEGWKFFPRVVASLAGDVREVCDSLKQNRCICIDLGSQQVKYALLESCGDEVKILNFGVVDLREEALLSSDEVDDQLAKIVLDLGGYPLAVTIPQQLVTSQTINLPDSVDESSNEEIQAYLKSVMAPGMGSTAFVTGYKKLLPLSEHTKLSRPYYTSITKEKSVIELVGRFVKSSVPIVSVIPSLNAASSSFIRKVPMTQENIVLVDMGAVSTSAAIVHQGQCILAANFNIGGEYLTEHLSKALRCTFEEAEQYKRENNYLSGEHVNAIFQAAVRRWLKDLVNWFQELSRSTATVRGTQFTEEDFKKSIRDIPIYLSGGASLTPGLLDYLKAKADMNFLPWPQYAGLPDGISSERFASCLGLGMETLKVVPSTGSLTPDNLVNARKVTRLRFHVYMTTLVLMPVLFCLLLAATLWVFISSQQTSKEIDEIHSAVKNAKTIVQNYKLRDDELYSFAPILRMHKETMDVLNILKSQQNMVLNFTNRFWFLSLADKRTYAAGEPSLDDSTNALLNIGDKEDLLAGKYTYITDLCLLTNLNDDPQRMFFSAVRDEIKNLHFVEYVDTLLPTSYSTNFVDSKYLIGGDRFGTVITTKGLFTERLTSMLTNRIATNTTPKVKK